MVALKLNGFIDNLANKLAQDPVAWRVGARHQENNGKPREAVEIWLCNKGT